jgi:hypothetical protein
MATTLMLGGHIGGGFFETDRLRAMTTPSEMKKRLDCAGSYGGCMTAGLIDQLT